MGGPSEKQPKCCSDCTDMNISKIGTLRFIGTLCIGVCAVEFALGTIIFRFLTNPYLLDYNGSWWAPIFVCLAGFCACFANNKSTVIASCVLATIGFCLAVIGGISDGTATYIFSTYTACGSTDQFGNVTNYGNYNDFNSTVMCMAAVEPVIIQPYNSSYLNQTHHIVQINNMTVTQNITKTQYVTLNRNVSIGNNECYCVTSGGAYCHGYELRHPSDNCGDLMGSYRKLLTASTIFCGLIFFFGVILSGLTITVLCQNYRHEEPEAIGHKIWLKDELANFLIADIFVTPKSEPRNHAVATIPEKPLFDVGVVMETLRDMRKAALVSKKNEDKVELSDMSNL